MTTYRGRALQALLLDLDDTILDNRTGVRGAWEVVTVALVGRYEDLEPDAVREAIGASTRAYWSDPVQRVEGRLDLPRARQAIVAQALERLERPDRSLAAHAAALYTEFRERSIAPLEGALEALARLRARVKRLALVTNGASEPQRAKIERFDLARQFDAIVIEGELGAGKPQPRVFQHALAALGAPADASLMVGDDHEADVLGALRAGLEAVWIDAEGVGAPPTLPPRPHLTLRALRELVPRIGD